MLSCGENRRHNEGGTGSRREEKEKEKDDARDGQGEMGRGPHKEEFEETRNDEGEQEQPNTMDGEGPAQRRSSNGAGSDGQVDSSKLDRAFPDCTKKYHVNTRRSSLFLPSWSLVPPSSSSTPTLNIPVSPLDCPYR